MDGFSRKFLWLVVASSNNDPLIIGNYYLQCISHYKFCPRLLRMDRGRENIYCEDLQVFFAGSTESFLYANSTRNQRIGASWSRLKKFRTSWWIEFFQSMVSRNIYKPQLDTHQEWLLFCFMPIIQKELNEFAHTWNLRTIRQSANTPGGKPDMFFMFLKLLASRKKVLISMKETCRLRITYYALNIPGFIAIKIYTNYCFVTYI